MAKTFSFEEAFTPPDDAEKPTTFSFEDALRTVEAKVDRGPATEGDPLNKVAPSVGSNDPTFAVSTGNPGGRKSSVLEGVILDQPKPQPFDAGEAERLSRKAYAQFKPKPTSPGAELKPSKEIEPRGFGGTIADTVLSLGQGAIGLVKGATDNINAGDNPASDVLGKAIEGLDYWKSDYVRDDMIKRQALIDSAHKNGGEIAAARAAFNSTFLNPAAAGDVIGRGVGSLIPTLMMGAAGLGEYSMMAVNALSNAGDAAQQTAEALRKMPEQDWGKDDRYLSLLSQGMTHKQAVETLAPIYALPSQSIGAITGAISGKIGLEQALTGKGLSQSIQARAGRALQEFAGEELETLLPQAVGNITQGSIDGKTSVMSGLGQAFADTALGTIGGSALAAVHSGDGTQVPNRGQKTAEEMARERGFLVPSAKPADILQATSVDEAIQTAQRALVEPAVPESVINAGKQWQDLGIKDPQADIEQQRAVGIVGKKWQELAAENQRMAEEAGAQASRNTDARIAEVGQKWQDLGITTPAEDLASQKTFGEPVVSWFGRRGDGYQSQEDAGQALPGRQKAQPEFDWKIEQMPNGRFRLAGYALENADASPVVPVPGVVADTSGLGNSQPGIGVASGLGIDSTAASQGLDAASSANPVDSVPARMDAAGQPSGALEDSKVVGSDAGNGFKHGPQNGERYRVGVVDSVGGAIAIEKRYPAGTAGTFYVGKDGNLIDGDAINLIGSGKEKLWIPATPEQARQAQQILDEMGQLDLQDPARKDAKERLKQVVSGKLQEASAQANAAGVQPDAVTPASQETPYADILAQLFPGKDQSVTQEKINAPTPQIDAPAIAKTVSDLRDSLQREREDWATRQYKANGKQVELAGDGPSNQGSMSVSSINEGRRQKAVQAADEQLRSLDKIDAMLSTPSGANQFSNEVQNIWAQAMAFQASPGEASGADLFERMLIDRLGLQPARGSYTSLPITKALRGMMEGTAAPKQPDPRLTPLSRRNVSPEAQSIDTSAAPVEKAAEIEQVAPKADGVKIPERIRYYVTKSPAYDGIEPLSVEDADFELEALENSAKKGRLTPGAFAQSEIGKRIDGASIIALQSSLKADPVGTIQALRSHIENKSEPAQVEAPKSAPVDSRLVPVSQRQAEVPNYSKMTYDELDKAHQDAIAANDAIDIAAVRKHMGDAAAEKFSKLSRRQKDKWMEANATEAMDKDSSAFNGINEEAIAEHRAAVNDFDDSSAEALGRSIAIKTKGIDDPNYKNTPEYTTVVNALRYAASKGWKESDVMSGMRSRANEWAGSDAPELFSRLFKEAAAKQPDQRLVPVSQRETTSELPDAIQDQPRRIVGQNYDPIDSGAKPFKFRKEAKDAQKQQPHYKVVALEKGFGLIEKTPGEIAAQEQAAKRLARANAGEAGKPESAHAFIISKGGLNQSAMADTGFDRNVRIGNRFLFAGKNKGGLTLAQAAELLHEAGYIGDETETTAATAIKRSATVAPLYTPEGIERMAEAEAQARFDDHLNAEQEAALADDFDPFQSAEDLGYEVDDAVSAGYDEASDPIKLEVNALLAQAEAAGIDTETLREDAARETLNQSEQAYYERTKLKLQQAIAQSARISGDAENRGTGSEGRQATESTGSTDRGEDAGSQGDAGVQEGLTSPTPEQVTAQQDRAANADELDQREQINREADRQTLTQQVAPEQRRDNTGDIFGGPTVEDVQRAREIEQQKAVEKSKKDDDGTMPMFSRGQGNANDTGRLVDDDAQTPENSTRSAGIQGGKGSNDRGAITTSDVPLNQSGEAGRYAGGNRGALNGIAYSKGEGRSSGLTLDQFQSGMAEAFGQKVADSLIEKGVVVPLEDQSKLPDHVVPFLRSGDIVYGFHDPKTDRTYAVLSNLTPGMIKPLALHEVGVHYGFEAMLGDKKYAAVMRRLDVMEKAGQKDVVAAAKSAKENSVNPRQIPEERLAYLVQNNPEMGIVREIIAAIKAFLFREFGIGEKYLTSDDLTALAKAAVMHASRTQDGGSFVPAFSKKSDRGTNDDMANRKDVVGNQGGRSADDTATGARIINPAWPEHERFATAWEDAGFKVEVTGSAHSDSRYVRISDPVSGADIEVRIADHQQSGRAMALHNIPDFEVGDFDQANAPDLKSVVPMVVDKINKERAAFKDAPLADGFATSLAGRLATNESIAPTSGGAPMFSKKTDKIDTPLSQDKFNRDYMVHIDVRGRDGSAAQNREAIMRDGFKSQFVNLLPMPTGNATAMGKGYAPKAGDTVYLVPKSGRKDSPNGMKVAQGWKPEPHEVVTITDPSKPLYDYYLEGFAPSRTDQTNTSEFRKWFGDWDHPKAFTSKYPEGLTPVSYAVDKDGKPLVLYHATNADFSTFDVGRKTINSTTFGDVETERHAIFATPDVQFAEEYFGSKSGANVMPVYMSIHSPIDLREDISGSVIADIIDNSNGKIQRRDFYHMTPSQMWQLFDGEFGRNFVFAARKAGYDGAILKEENTARTGQHDVYAAFEPTQIKSAIGNNGAFDPTNPDIRFSRSLVTGNPLPTSWQAPDATKMDDFIYSMQDKHIDTKRVVKSVRDSIGALADEIDPYLQEELFHGRAAMQTKEFLEKEVRPLLTDMQARGIEISDFEEYLHNRHAERRNAQVAKINPAMQDGGSGIKTQDARAYLAGLTTAERTAYEALAKKVDAISKNTRDLLVDSGLEKQSTIDAWDQAYGSEYVPLMREEMDNGMGIGQGFSVRGSSSKRAMGSDKPVANIIANIALQREKAITRSEKRKIGEALYGLVLSAPNPDFWIAVDPALQQNPAQITATAMQLISMGMNPADADSISREPTQRYVNPVTGFVEERINPAMRSADNVLAVRIDGEDKYVFFNAKDERAMRMAMSLKNLDSDQLGVVMGGVANMTRYFAAVNTQYNPIFGVTNIARDVQTAMLNLQSTALKGHQADVAKHILPALRGIYIDLRNHRQGKPATSSYAQIFEEFQREGGATGFRDMYANAEERADAIRDEIADIGAGKLKQAGKGIMGWLSDYNETMENAVRVAAYKVAKEQGMSNQQAASLAKNLTVNFNRKGQVALQAGALYAFFNASVQGTARIAQTLTENGKLTATGRNIIAGGLLIGSMQALLLAAAGFDDDEPPDFVRERSLVIPIGGKKYISIPMPLGFHIIPNLSRIPTEWAMGGFKNTTKRISQLVGVFADGLNPIGSAGLSIQTITPTIIDPLAALAENKDWTGKPIAKKDIDTLHPTAGHTRAKDTATPWAKIIAYGVNAATGGTDFKPGMASPTPDQIDYLIGQAFGGVGRELGKLAQMGESRLTGEEIPLHKIPLVGRFVGTTEGQAAESSRFYNNLREIGEHKVEIAGLKKNGRGAEISAYIKDNKESTLYPMADAAQRKVSQLNTLKRDLIKKGASPDRIKLIDMQITSTMKLLNDRARALKNNEPALAQ